MTPHDVNRTLPWMGAGTEFVCRLVDAMPDDALGAPSGLPGWSRAHIVAHLARNAQALTRLATWARTGVETPMYTDVEQRTSEIESLAKEPAETLRRQLVTTAADLDAALASLTPDQWQATVRTARGRAVPAAEVPWMRVREVWMHAVDLDSGASVADLPPAVVDDLLDDATEMLSGSDGCPAAVLAPIDRDRTWALGPAADDAVTVQGTAAAVLAWLIGRTTADGLVVAGPGGVDTAAPVPPRWL